MAAKPPRIVTVIGSLLTICGLAAFSPTQASIITPDPVLPTKSGQYVLTSGGIGCFAGLGICTIPAAPSGMLPVSTSFDASGQTVHWLTIYSLLLTQPNLTPITGPIMLTGMLDEKFVGRTGQFETGTWTTIITGLDLIGTVAGVSITATLDPNQISSGLTSLLPVPDGYAIDSHVDIFADLTVDAGNGLVAHPSPVHLELVSVPEPAAGGLFALPLFFLVARRRRRRS